MLSGLIDAVCSHQRLLVGLFILQGFLGVALFEWAWKTAERVRKGEEKMMQEFPYFRRLDVHLWSRWKFYPGCFIMLVPRTLWLFGWLFAVGFW